MEPLQDQINRFMRTYRWYCRPRASKIDKAYSRFETLTDILWIMCWEIECKLTATYIFETSCKDPTELFQPDLIWKRFPKSIYLTSGQQQQFNQLFDITYFNKMADILAK